MDPPARLAEALRISPQQTAQVLEFLVSKGLAIQKGGHYSTGPFHVHFGEDLALITRHHLNWRLNAMQCMERMGKQDLHYSSVVNIAKKDREKLRAQLVESIARARKIVEPSPEEALFGFNLDFFEL